jgi:antibiotic biosynthesis monooxygenase (ABM) superfamily enzyme
MHTPKKWKMAVLVWIAIYPTITLLFITLGNKFAQIAFLPLRTFVITLIVVPLMVFVITPFLQHLMAGWLKK